MIGTYWYLFGQLWRRVDVLTVAMRHRGVALVMACVRVGP